MTGAIHHTNAYYGPGAGPVHMDGVVCSGSESSLSSCQYSLFGDVSSNCRSHFDDISVSCTSGIVK